MVILVSWENTPISFLRRFAISFSHGSLKVIATDKGFVDGTGLELLCKLLCFLQSFLGGRLRKSLYTQEETITFSH